MSKVSDSILKRVYLLFGIFLFLGVVIVIRIIGLQLNQDKWLQKEVEERVFFKKVVADRGNILSEQGEIMATSIPYYRIGMDPVVVDTLAIEGFQDSLMVLASKLASYFGEEFQDTMVVNDTVLVPYWRKDTMQYFNRVMDAMREGDRHIYLTRKVINFKELQMVEKWPILNLGRYKGGLVVEKIHNKRYYPYGDLARVTLGLMMHDTVGIRGIEASYNDALRGRDGYMLAQKVVGGSYIPLDKYGEEESTDGYDIITTLDVDLQDVVEKALQEGVERYQAKAGAAILLEVATGEIKALANWPETYNHAVAVGLEPGSTFKLAAAAAALEDSIIDLTDTIDTGNGKVQYDEWVISDDAAYGRIPFTKVFARSSNVGMSKVIFDGYGEEPLRFLEHLYNFGFFEPANTQLLGEPEPIIYKPGDDMWNIATLPSMAYGYSLRVTVLQMAAFYNAIANGGKRVRPWIIKEIRNGPRLVRSFGPEVLHEQIVRPATVEKLHVLMEEVVANGTAQRALRGMEFRVAGKTGTARKIIDGRYRQIYRSSFGGFFPADNPRFTCYIMIDEARGERVGGGTVAAPVFRAIAEEVYTMDRDWLHQKERIILKPLPQPRMAKTYASRAGTVLEEMGLSTTGIPDSVDWVLPRSNGHQINFKSFDPGQRRIPNLRGMTARDAVAMLENMGVKVSLRGHGRVRQQSLQPGFIIGEDAAITFIPGIMRLTQLVADIPDITWKGEAERDIDNIQFDSRQAGEESLFVAIKGTKFDGHTFIDMVRAKAIMCEDLPARLKPDVTYLQVADSRRALSLVAAAFFGHPALSLQITGITGTNGKSSVAVLLHELFNALGLPAGLISTLYYKVGEKEFPASHTTPDPLQLQGIFREMVDAGCSHCFMEVSSHALHQERVAGIPFKLGVFTNITHDHLDYHGSFKEYIRAKKRLFDQLNRKAVALINIDDRNGRVMVQNTRAQVRSFGLERMADYRAKLVESTFEGLQLEIDNKLVWFRLLGTFNAYNLLTVFASAVELGMDRDTVLLQLSGMKGVPGRLQVIRIYDSKLTGVVDYAHTPDALQNVLSTLSDINRRGGKIITVFGCGGNRDKEKRPKMGRIAAEFSDHVIITSDNPRYEHAESIIEEIAAGVPLSFSRKVLKITHRREAIRTAVRLAHDRDIVLVAGKGHETYQEIEGVKTPFDDREVLLRCISEIS